MTEVSWEGLEYRILPQVGTFFGMKVVVDETLPPGTVELQFPNGDSIKIENVGQPPGPRMQ